jgi:hypothetical protein
MGYPVYYVEENDTLPHLFDTFDGGTGASITMTGLAVTDIEIYKDGSATQRSSDVGYTLLDTDGIDFDGITGIHGFSIDLSDDTDAGFFSVGSWYHVVVSAITVDSQTVSFVACAFRIVSATRGMAGTALPAAAADAAGGLTISDAGGLDVDTLNSNVTAILDDTDLIDDGTSGLAKIATDVAAILVDTAEIGAAGAGLTEAGGTGDQLTAIPWNASWDTEVQSECNDALVALSLDHLFASATGLEVANSSILARLVSKSATPVFTDFDNQTDSLQAIRDRGDSAWITATSVTVSDKTGFSLASDGMDSVTLPADIITASSLAADAVQEIWTTTLTEAYATDGSAFTPAQGLFMIWSALSEFAISGTTITAKKLDGSTTSMTFTLDSSTAPTSRTRAT